MGHFDLSLNTQLVLVMASIVVSAVVLTEAVVRRLRREAAVKGLFHAPQRDPSQSADAGIDIRLTGEIARRRSLRKRRSAALRAAIMALPLALLGLAFFIHVSPAKAEDRITQQAALADDPAPASGAAGTVPALTLDLSALRVETGAWRSDAQGLSADRQARIQSCYGAARAAHRGGGEGDGFGNVGRLGDLNRSVSGFHSSRKRAAQFDGCVR